MVDSENYQKTEKNEIKQEIFLIEDEPSHAFFSIDKD